MSWLYSQALVAEYSAANCSDGAPFAPSNGNHTPQAYLPPDKMTDFSRPSRFGMTFAPLTDDRGEELLTWFRAGFRARTSAPQEKAPGSTASEAGFGEKWRELSVRYDPDTSSWRTHRCLWDEDLSACSLTLPKWGLMRDGVLLERMTLALPTAANDAGLWRTPTVGMLNADRAKDPEYTARKEAKGQTITLADQVKNPRMWPTPKAGQCGLSAKTTGRGVEKSTHLTTQVALAEGLIGEDGKVNTQAAGQLNPNWVEWLMGWPLGWTDLKPLATDRCRNAQRQHGGF